MSISVTRWGGRPLVVHGESYPLFVATASIVVFCGGHSEDEMIEKIEFDFTKLTGDDVRMVTQQVEMTIPRLESFYRRCVPIYNDSMSIQILPDINELLIGALMEHLADLVDAQRTADVEDMLDGVDVG